MTGHSSNKHQNPITELEASFEPRTLTQQQLPSLALKQKIGLWLNTIECSEALFSTNPGKRKRSSSLPLTETRRLKPADLAQFRTSPPQSGSEEITPASEMCANWIQTPPTPAYTLSSINDPSTPTSQSSKERSVLSRKPEWIRGRLAQHGIVKTGRDILQQKYPEFDALIQRILLTDRHSAMKPTSVRKFSSRHEFFESANEDSVLAHLIPLLIKESHLQKLSPESAEYKMLRKEKEACNEWWEDDEDIIVSRDWFDEGVTFTVNREFRGSLLPNTYENDDLEPSLSKVVSKGDGLSNPKPDYCWGLRPDLLDTGKPGDIRFNSDVVSLLQLVPPLESAFFLIEGKSNQGNPLQAAVQAQRGGAALVNAARMLSKYITPTDATDEGADTHSFVFSATLTIQCMEIYVHWAEILSPTASDTDHLQDYLQASKQAGSHVTGDTPTDSQYSNKLRTIFHMTFLKSYALRDYDRLPELRQVLHNILQWGATDRLEQVKSQRLRLYDYQHQQKAAMKAGDRTHRSKRQRNDDSGKGKLSEA